MADDSPRAVVPNDRLEQFKEKVHESVKKMLYDGFTPKTKLWAFTKIVLMIKDGKELGLDVVVDEENYKKAGAFIKKHKWLQNYRFLYLLNKIVSIKKYLKRYYWMDGHKLYVKLAPKMGEIVQDYQLLDIWEPETTALVKEKVKKGMVCLDIGASVGYFTLLFSRQVGETGSVISIEPTDFQLPYLMKNIKNNGYEDRVEVHNIGAWHKNEMVAMPLNAPEYVQTYAPCMRVDDIIAGRRVDFVKMDCDGPEPKILLGMEQTIKDNPQMQMVIEYYPEYIRNAGLDPAEFREIIDKYFKIQIIPGDYENNCWNLYCVRQENATNVWPKE